MLSLPEHGIFPNKWFSAKVNIDEWSFDLLRREHSWDVGK